MESKNISVPLAHIGDEYILNFGVRPKHKNEHNYLLHESHSEWLKPTLEEYDLLEVKNYDGQLTLSRADQIVRVKGHLKLHPTLECVKCLTRFRSLVETPVEAYFSPEQKNEKKVKEEVELKSDELTEYEYKNNQVVLDELLVDAIETSMPEAPYCKPDCLGLCLECGVDQNAHGICAQHNKIQ